MSGMREGPTRWNGTWVWARSRSAPAAASRAPTSAAEVPGPPRDCQGKPDVRAFSFM
ncbi:hypothetical protein SFUMM280S_10471 [Streptomyces fumanus]